MRKKPKVQEEKLPLRDALNKVIRYNYYESEINKRMGSHAVNTLRDVMKTLEDYGLVEKEPEEEDLPEV